MTFDITQMANLEPYQVEYSDSFRIPADIAPNSDPMTNDSENLSASEIADLQLQFAAALRDRKMNSLSEFVAKLDGKLSVKDLASLATVAIEYRLNCGESAKLSDYYDEFPQLVQVGNAQTITKVVYETTAACTEVFHDHPTEKTRQLITPGDTIDDFELLAELGRGSFATVFLARQISMQRMVALKVSADHGMEAQTLAQLDHPNIVRVFDQRRARDFDLQLLYMQYLEGGTLLDVCEKIQDIPKGKLNGKQFVECVDESVIDRGASPNYESTLRNSFLDSNWEQTVCRIGFSLARALEYAHKKGVLHRDIKPANVLIGSDCSVKLADFNISSAESVVGETMFGGSIAYMSPEQIRAFNPDDEFMAKQLEARCDIYSLGVMLFQLLTRELPFSAFSGSRSASGLKLMISERENSSERITSQLKKQSPLLRKALLRCLQGEIEDRPASAQDLANQLKVGLDRQAEQFLFPSKRNWTLGLQKHFYLVCVAVNLIFNIMAVLFVLKFNLFDSVPEAAHRTFGIITIAFNGVVFPLAIAIFFYVTASVPKALRSCLGGTQSKVANMQLAMVRNLASGHIFAVICGSFWLFAGFAFPVLLYLSGAQLTGADWLDFVASHWLSGTAITALSFFAITYLSLRIWLPVLIQDSFAEEVVSTVAVGLNSLISKIPIYQLIAVSVPLLGIAILVIFGDLMTRSKFPLTVISLFGLLTIPIVLFGGNKIRAICERLLVVFRQENGDRVEWH